MAMADTLVEATKKLAVVTAKICDITGTNYSCYEDVLREAVRLRYALET